jgi:hypothetical protein
MFIENFLGPLTSSHFATACLQEPPRYQDPEYCIVRTLVLKEGRVSYPTPFIQVLVCDIIYFFVKNSLQEKAVEATKQKKKGERRKKPKPEEQEGMPRHQRCPLEKRRGDKNPECHEEQQKDVA